MKALILCAGKGERLRPLTETVPKPMLRINNKPVLEYLILLCKKHEITDIAVNTSYLPEKIKEYFGNGKKFGVNINYSFEPELLGTSGALNNFRDFFKDAFFVIYGDQITDIDLTKMMAYHKKKGGIATIAVRKKPKDYHSQSIIFSDKELRLTKFIEKPSDKQVEELSGDFKLINSGLYVLGPEVFKFIPKGVSDFAFDIIPKLINEGKKVYGFIMDKYYFREIGKIEKYNSTKKEIESGEVKLNFISNQMNKAVFIDRDGVIDENIYEPDGKIMSPANLEQLKILSNVKEGIKEMKKLGFKIISITNQPGVAFGYILPRKLEEINNFLKRELGIDEIYFCPHHPKFNDACECRKPKIGLLLKAVGDFNIDIKKSYMIGDSLSDVQMGKNAGVKKTFRIGTIREDIIELQHKKGIFPDYTCSDLLEVAGKIKEIEKKGRS